MPPGIFIPQLAYADVRGAASWLCTAFGFSERLRIADHRVQLTFGPGSMVVVERQGPASDCRCSTMVRVAAIDEHCRTAEQNGAKIIRLPQTHPYGERQYTAEDIGGHLWTFTESVKDIHPIEYGGELLQE